MRIPGPTDGHATGPIERARLLELMRVRYGPDSASAALDRAIDDANLSNKAAYDPPEVDRIADEIALRPLERAELLVLLLWREAALAAASRGIVGEAPAGRGRKAGR